MKRHQSPHLKPSRAKRQHIVAVLRAAKAFEVACASLTQGEIAALKVRDLFEEPWPMTPTDLTQALGDLAVPEEVMDAAIAAWPRDDVGQRKNRILAPSANKFHRGAPDGKHYWLTPPDLYAQLDAEFRFDFDPCPYPLPDGFDGLTCEWGQRNYVNPPFGSILHEGKRKGPTAWVRKALAEHAKGKLVVMVYPLDKWVLMMLAALECPVRNLGDVRWHAIEDGVPGPGTGRHIACFVLRNRGL